MRSTPTLLSTLCGLTVAGLLLAATPAAAWLDGRDSKPIEQLQLMTPHELAWDAMSACQMGLLAQKLMQGTRAYQAIDYFERLAVVARAQAGGTEPPWVTAMQRTWLTAIRTHNYAAGTAECLTIFQTTFLTPRESAASEPAR